MKSALFHSVRDGDAEITFSYNEPMKSVMIYMEDHANNTFISAKIDEEAFIKIVAIIKTEIIYQEVKDESKAAST